MEKISKNEKEISQTKKSRVYHTIANIKKEKAINEDWKNQCGLPCVKNNDYKKLTEEELDEVVKYEDISDKALRMGEKIGFKYESMKR